MGQTWTQVAAPALVSNAAATKYTVPASSTLKINNIHVDNPGGGTAATFTLSIGADAAGTRIFDAITIQPGVPFDSYGPFYVPAGIVIQAFSGTNNVLTLSISGILSTP